LHALVTGGGGFLGRYVVEHLLARGDRVRSIARGAYPELEASGVECLRGDLREPEAARRACQGVDVVFHTAATAGIWGRWDHYHGINTQATIHLIDACRELNVPRFVFTSSPSVIFGPISAG